MKKYLSSYTYFRLAFILYIFINTLALGYLGISNTFLSVIIIIWGIYLIINDIFQKQINMNKNFIYIGMYGIILLLATILNQKYSDLKSYILAIVQIIIFCLLFNNQKSITITSIKKEISLIITFTNILVGFAILISIIMYFFNIYDSKNGWIIVVS